MGRNETRSIAGQRGQRKSKTATMVVLPTNLLALHREIDQVHLDLGILSKIKVNLIIMVNGNTKISV